jgi:hypothetical protein
LEYYAPSSKVQLLALVPVPNVVKIAPEIHKTGPKTAGNEDKNDEADVGHADDD